MRGKYKLGSRRRAIPDVNKLVKKINTERRHKMKVSNTSIWIIIVLVCMLAVLACVTLSKGNNNEDKNRSSTAVPAKDLGVKLAMSHGPVKDGLAAFLICEQNQFKLDEPIPLLYGVVYYGLAESEYPTIPVPYPAVDPGNISWLSVTGPDGNDIPYIGVYVMFPLLDPRDVLRLKRRCFHGRLTPNIRDDFKLCTPGLYTIKWHYRISPTSDASWWTGKLISNEVQFEIVNSDVSSRSQTVQIGNQILSFSGNISAGGPFLRIQLLPPQGVYSNYPYRLEIRGREDVLIQSVSIRNGVPIYKDGFEVVDLNADGYKDIRLLGGKDRAGDRWYKSWLYNPNTKKYVWPGIQPGPR